MIGCFRQNHTNAVLVTNHTQHQEICGLTCHHTPENGPTTAIRVVVVLAKKLILNGMLKHVADGC